MGKYCIHWENEKNSTVHRRRTGLGVIEGWGGDRHILRESTVATVCVRRPKESQRVEPKARDREREGESEHGGRGGDTLAAK